ncbi:hypothetical protein R3P38DRAFT_3216288 [Favolaschia claudopus]|uniref:Uncharacterized protein n=1 Tax=Favolaschia claudopus TaxID=2862362 RepID=A0AAW0A8F8_9AGAR
MHLVSRKLFLPVSTAQARKKDKKTYSTPPLAPASPRPPPSAARTQSSAPFSADHSHADFHTQHCSASSSAGRPYTLACFIHLLSSAQTYTPLNLHLTHLPDIP